MYFKNGVLLCGLLVSLTNLSCSSTTNLAGTAKKSEKSKPPQSADAEFKDKDIPIVSGEEIVESFRIGKDSIPVSLGMIVDNSGSMSPNYQNVKDNLNALIESLQNMSGVSAKIISAKKNVGFYTGVGALDQSAFVEQLDMGVGSYNLMTIAAMALCPKTDTSILESDPNSNDTSGFFGGNYITKIKICGKTFDDTTVLSQLEDGSEALKAAGFFHESIAKSANPLIIFVSDENETFIDDKNFMDLVSPHLISKPKFAGFVAKNADISSPSGFQRGLQGAKAYEELAKQVDMSLFDIFKKDWSSDLAELLQKIETSTKRKYELKHSSITSVQVFLDDQEIEPSKYVVEDGILNLNSDLGIENADMIKVIYKAK